MEEMTPRERFLAAARLKPTDRIPVDYCTRDDVAEKLVSYLGLNSREDLYQKLGIDSRRLLVGENNPAFLEKVRKSGKSVSGLPRIFYDDGSYENAWGIVSKPSADGLYVEWVRGPFSDDSDINSFPWPGFDILESVESLKKRIDAYGGRYATIGTINYPFKVCWSMRGLENYLCDMLVDEDFARELMEKAASYELEKGLRLVEAGIDIVSFSGDIAMQDRMMVSVPAWREIDKPIFADIIKKLKSKNPDILIYYHSDGNMEEVMEDMIEIGVDIINPIQPESMDVNRIYREYGHRVALHGTISIQETLPRGSIEDVRNETLSRVNLSKKNGGLILAPSNHVQNDTPLENIIEIYRAAGSFQY